MGEGESLNEMVRNAGGYADPAIASDRGQRADAGGRARRRLRRRAPARRSPSRLPRRAECRLQAVAGDSAARWPRRRCAPAIPTWPAGRDRAGGLPPRLRRLADRRPGDGDARSGPRAPPPACCARRSRRSSAPWSAIKPLPIATRLEIAERGEALAIIEATRLGDLYLEARARRRRLPPAMARRARLVAAARNATQRRRDRCSRSPPSMARRAAARCSPPSRARAPPACSTCRPSRSIANVAQEAMRGFLLLGDKQQTQAWTRLALTAVSQQRARHDRARPADAAGRHRRHRRSQAPAAGEINRWYEVMPRGRCRRARRCAATCCSNCCAPPASTCRAGTTELPEAGRPATSAWSCRRPPPCRRWPTPRPARRRAETALLALDRRRRDAAQRAPSCRRRRHRAGPAPGRRGPCGAPVRDRSRRSPTASSGL